MKLPIATAILTTVLLAPAGATTVYAGFCLPCGAGTERLLFSNQTPDGFTLTGLTVSTGYEVDVTGDGTDVLHTLGWSRVRSAGGGGFSEVSFSIAGAGFRELMLRIRVLEDVPLTVTVNGTEVLGPVWLHDHWINFLDVEVPEGSLMTLITLSVPGDYFLSLSHIRFGGITDADIFNGETPEPATVTLMLSGLGAICAVRRRSKTLATAERCG